MREYGKVAPSFWMGETGREIIQSGPESTIVALYLMTSPHANMLGMYYLPIQYIAHDVGLTLQGASKGLQRVCEAGLCGYDKGAQVVWVYEMARYQVEDSLKPGDKRVVGINKEYQRLPKCSFLGDFFDKYHKAFHLENRRGSEAPCKPLRSQEQEQEQEQEQDYLKSPKGDFCRAPRCPTDSTALKKRNGDGDSVPYSDIVAKLNEICGCQFKPETVSTRRHIKARWNEGWRLPDFVAVIESRFSEWGSDPKMCAFLRPETLFGTKFESYLQLAKTGSSRTFHASGSTAPPNQDDLVRKIRQARAEREQKNKQEVTSAKTAPA